MGAVGVNSQVVERIVNVAQLFPQCAESLTDPHWGNPLPAEPYQRLQSDEVFKCEFGRRRDQPLALPAAELFFRDAQSAADFLTRKGLLGGSSGHGRMIAFPAADFFDAAGPYAASRPLASDL